MVVPLPVAFIRFLISINRFWKFQYDVEEIATRLLDFHYNITVVSIFIIILVRSDMQLKSCFKFIIFEVFCNKCDGTMLMCHWNAFLCSLVYTDYKKKRCQLKSFGKRDYRLFKVTWLTWLNQLRRGRSLPGPLFSQLISHCLSPLLHGSPQPDFSCTNQTFSSCKGFVVFLCHFCRLFFL